MISSIKNKTPKFSFFINAHEFAIFLTMCFAVIVFTAAPSAFAQSISLPFASYTLNDGAVTGSPVLITVTDSSANLNTSDFDTVLILVTSTTDPLGITLVLTETGVNSGVFQNTNLIFTTGNAQYLIGNTITVSIVDNSQNSSTSAIDTVAVTVRSTIDPSGISLSLSETDVNTGIFQGTLAFTSSTSSGNAIQVTGGNIVSITYPLSAEISNGLIVPNPNSGIGAIKTAVGDTITVTYSGLTDTATIISSGPGGGGGGPIRAGLVIDSFGGGGGCKSDCIPPTLGMTQGGKRLVDNGFSYNGNPVNVEQYYTPYPLITVTVGQQNVAKLKVYENSGMQNIRHVELGFGLGKDQFISESKAVIEYDINFDGTTKTSLFDPYNVLDDVSVTSEPAKCKFEEPEENCIEFSFYHTFRESLEFNMVGTNVWDDRRNGWQNYYNDGVEIIGDSLNPPKKIQVLDRSGYPKTISIIEKDVGIDDDGNIWKKDGQIWSTDYVIPVRNDPITMHGIDRNNDKFGQYLQEQIMIAQNTFAKITQHKQIQNTSFGFNDNPQIVISSKNRIEDIELQQSIILEINKAEELSRQLWPELFYKDNS